MSAVCDDAIHLLWIGDGAAKSRRWLATFGFAGYSIALNLQTAFDTLGSQAFGAQNYPRVGVLLQRTLFIMFCACVPVSRLFLWAARCFV